MRKRGTIFLVVAAALIILLFIGLRVRLAKATYHSERMLHWLHHFLGKMLRIQNTLALRSEVEELDERFSEILTQIRYVDMALGHHDERLHALTGVGRLREPEDNEIARLWLAVSLFRDRLREGDPPPDLSGRCLVASDKLDPIIRRMRAILDEPKHRALLMVPTLSREQKEEFNALVRDSMRIVLEAGDIEPGEVSSEWYFPE